MTSIPKAPVIRIIKELDQEKRISKDAENLIIEAVEGYARFLGQQAIAITNHVDRKTIQGDDVEFAAKQAYVPQR